MKNIKIIILFLILLIVGQISNCQQQTPQDIAQGIMDRIYSKGSSTNYLEKQLGELIQFKKSLTEERDPLSYAGVTLAIDQLAKLTNKNPSIIDENLYKKSTDHSDQQAVQRLTSESLISPEMQWEVLSYLGERDVVVNKDTGLVQNIPSTQQLLDDINQKLQYSITNDQKESMKDSLHTMLEATDIAIFVASVEAAYKDQNFMLYQIVNSQLLIDLNDQKLAIQATMNNVNSITPIDAPAQESSYFSWFYQPGPANQITTMEVPMIMLDPNSPTFTIRAKLMKAIIKSNDYKSMADPTQAANILFKQCFIAQQHHLKDTYRMNNIKINLQSPVTGHNYIYTNFPNIYNKSQNSYPICDIAKNIVPASQVRYDLQAPVTTEQKQAHQLLLDIRQSIQTAIFIANRKSNVNVGYLLPSSVVSYLDGIVGELMNYDAQLSILCKDPRYGATPEDTYQSEQWAMITKAAAGIAVTAIIGGGLYAYGPSVAGYASSKASDIGTWASNWWSGSSPNNQSASGASGASQPTAPPANTGTQNAMWANAQYGVGLLQQASAAGTAIGLLGKMTGNPALENIAKDLKMVGGVASTSLSLATIGSSKGIFDAGSRLMNAYFTLPAAAITVNNYMSGAQPTAQGSAPLASNKLYTGFEKMIDDATAQGTDLSNVIDNAAAHLLKSKKTDASQLLTVFQGLQQKYAQIPTVSDALNKLIVKVGNKPVDRSMEMAQLAQ